MTSFTFPESFSDLSSRSRSLEIFEGQNEKYYVFHSIDSWTIKPGIMNISYISFLLKSFFVTSVQKIKKKEKFKGDNLTLEMLKQAWM